MDTAQRSVIDLCLGVFRPGALKSTNIPSLRRLTRRFKVESYILETLSPHQAALSAPAADWLAQLRDRVCENAVANLKRWAAARDILDSFDQDGIAFILLKGAAMQVQRVGSTGRYQCDIDLLLHLEDVARAETLLRASGYEFYSASQSREFFQQRHFHFAYQKNGVVLELHWNLARPERPVPEGFIRRVWQRSRVVDLGEGRWRVPAPEHQLLLGCAHLSKHAFLSGLRWLADLRSDLLVPDETWQRFEAEARSWPARMIYTPLWFLADWGVAGAPEVSDRLDIPPLERKLLKTFLTHHLLGKPWLGLPKSLTPGVLRNWLGSRRSLSLLLVSGLRSRAIRYAGSLFRRLTSAEYQPVKS